MVKTPSYIIILAALILWLGTTAAVSYSSYHQYQEEWRNKSLEASNEINQYLQDYKELTNAFENIFFSTKNPEKKRNGRCL